MKSEFEDKISIIIPVYNVEHYIARCLDSILNQSYTNIEIIIINDGSSDSSGDIIEKYERKYKQIKLIKIENHGVSHARNIGINYAKGKYIVFVDSDDYVEMDYIEKLHNNIKKFNSELAVCGFDFGENNKKNSIQEKCVISEKSIMYHQLLSSEKFSGYLWNKMFSASIIKDNKMQFNENIHITEDLLFIAQYLEFCEKITVINIPLYHYIIRKNSALNSKFSKKQISKIEAIEQLVKLYEKYNKEDQENLMFHYVYTAKKSLYLMKKYSIKDDELMQKLKNIIKNNYKPILKKSCLNNKIKLIAISKIPYVLNVLEKLKRIINR